tara:strand:- start:865 stop:1188 length:324 start_codon:yes stop_codon:yes gene_type:complete
MFLGRAVPDFTPLSYDSVRRTQERVEVNFSNEIKLNSSAAREKLSVKGLGNGVMCVGSRAAVWSLIQNMMKSLTDKKSLFAYPLCRGLVETFQKCGCKIYGWDKRSS